MDLTNLSSASLEEIFSTLQERFYKPISDIYSELAGLEADHPGIFVLQQFLGYRQNDLIPYLATLTSRVMEGHNCSNCSGKCAIVHAAILPELRAGHELLRSLLQPDVSPIEDPDLQVLLVTALMIESTWLIPAIAGAQIQINAAG